MSDQFQSQYLCNFEPTEKERKLYEFAKRYHVETELYDRTVCTGQIVRDSIMPMYPWELAAINKNARKKFMVIAEEASRHGIDVKELRKAISRYPA